MRLTTNDILKEINEINHNNRWKVRDNIINMCDILTHTEPSHFIKYQEFFNNKGIDLLQYAFTEALEIEKDKKISANKYSIRGFRSTINTRIWLEIFQHNSEYKIDNDEKLNIHHQLMNIILDDYNIHPQSSILDALKISLQQNIAKITIAKWFALLVKIHPTIDPNLLKRFNQIRKEFTEDEIKQHLSNGEYKFLKGNNKSGQIEREVNAKIYRINIPQKSHMQQISKEVVVSNFNILSHEFSSLLSSLDDYVSVNITNNKELNTINVLYEKEGSGLTIKIADKLINFCLSENMKYEPADLSLMLEKLKEVELLNIKLSPKEENLVKRMKI